MDEVEAADNNNSNSSNRLEVFSVDADVFEDVEDSEAEAEGHNSQAYKTCSAFNVAVGDTMPVSVPCHSSTVTSQPDSEGTSMGDSVDEAVEMLDEAKLG